MKFKNNLDKKVLEHHYEQLFKYANDIITLHDEDLKIVEVNDSALKVYGYTREEMLGMDVSLLFAPSMRKHISKLKKTLDEVGFAFFETTRIKKDGSEFPVEISARVIEIEGLKYCQSIGRDITERKRAEEQTEQLKEYIQLQIERMPIGLIVWDTDFRVSSWNPAAENIFGFTAQEALGNHPYDIIVPNEALLLVHDIWRRLLEGDTTAHSINDNKTKDGRTIVCQWSNTPLKEADGTVRGVLSMVQDITDRKQAEERLKSSEERLKILFDYAPDAYYLSDLKGDFLDGNIAAEKLMGYDRNELIGKNFLKLKLLSPKQIPLVAKLLAKNLLGQGTGPDEFVLKRKDGLKVTVEIITHPVRIKDQTLVLGIARDINERKKAEEELIIAKEKAEEGDRLKTAFLQNISHEIRTPMNAIVGFSALLNEPDIDSATRQFYNDMIMNGSDQLLSIITDIIDISNIEANIVKTTKNEVNLNFIIRSLYAQFLLKANEREITLVSEPGLPDEDSIILTDKTKLIQIISNLLNNAFKFTMQGQIKFGYIVKDKLLEFFVSDTGLGIPEKYHQKIFDRFYQVADPVNKLNEGTGVGLSISRAYVELLGGEIRLSSTPGGGSTFIFTLPFEKFDDTVIAPSTTMEKVNFVFPENKKILVAEDIDSNFKLIEYFLSGANADIIRAYNGKEAVEKCLSDQSIDLVLMDIRMPVMNGYTATEMIRLSKPDIPIIAQTAYADDRERAIECGCSGIISKPFDKKGLFEVISEFI